MLQVRHYSFFDKICLCIDQTIRTLGDNPKTTGAPYPASSVQDTQLTEKEQKESAALMRINHAGEICAQALYHGQGIVSRSSSLQKKMQKAAIEEGDHLTWCLERLHELGSHTSYLNPVWYLGSFCIGMTAGLMGETWSLGFVAETEKQVVKHLEGHLQILKEKDARSFAILQQMEKDETKHRDEAMEAGAEILPNPIKQGMSLLAKVMVKTAYFI